MQNILKKCGSISLSGCVDSQKLHMIFGLSEGIRYRLIVTFSEIRMKEIYDEYKFYDRNVMMFPAKDLIFYQADVHSNDLIKDRIQCYRRLLEGTPLTVVTTFDALIAKQVPLAVLQHNCISLFSLLKQPNPERLSHNVHSFIITLRKLRIIRKSGGSFTCFFPVCLIASNM